ncbi:hypothetical protein [Rhodococcus jostii]|uniref:hypothetical protein n=1 Tax=Rhodococcus jostii TaxID=132919 RepID=UPI003657EF49
MHHSQFPLFELHFGSVIDHYDEFYPPDPGFGYLYVIEFDTGWIKVGKTTNWLRRRSDNLAKYRRLGWTVARPPWKSCLLSNESPDERTPSDLGALEQRLLREARRTSDQREFNPSVRGIGRDPSKPAATELFSGCSFDYLTAYADVLARTDAFR